MQISSVHNLYCYDDGDVITPRMGVSIDTGFGLQQWWNPSTKSITNTDFAAHNAILYPQPYSSKNGKVVVPSLTGQQWYLQNPDSEDSAILENGTVKAKYAGVFAIGVHSVNGVDYPSLTIKANFIPDINNVVDITDKYIYYKSTYDGKSFTCSQVVKCHTTVGDTYDVLLSYDGGDGKGDDVLSNDTDHVLVTAQLQQQGNDVSGATYTWQKIVAGAWTDLSSGSGLTINGNTMNITEAAVEGIETFRCVAHYNSNEYKKPFEISDVHDPYYIDDGCSAPGDTVKKDETVTFTPSVYDRSSGEKDTNAWTYAFTVIGSDDGNVIAAYSLTGSTISIPGSEIYNHKGIKVRTEARR